MRYAIIALCISASILALVMAFILGASLLDWSIGCPNKYYEFRTGW